MNLLHFNFSKPRTCFSHLLCPSSGRCFCEAYIKKEIKTKVQNLYFGLVYSHSEASVHGLEIFKIDVSIHGVIQEGLKLEGFSVLASFSLYIYQNIKRNIYVCVCACVS